jgi:vacuolar-type H+-ATPase subunit F/Vma7
MGTRSTIAALGEERLVQGYALAGVHVVVAGSEEAVRAAWRALPSEVAVVILTPAAAAALGAIAEHAHAPLTAVLPR